MKVCIVGASGLVGSNVFRYFKLNNIPSIGSHLSQPTDETFYYNTLNPESDELEQIFTFQPDVIIHCGALTHVDYCEENEKESYEKTVQSTINLLKIAKNLKAKFVYISTDYVFDGEKGEYNEEDEVKPLSVYGNHKLMAEDLVRDSGLEWLIVRVAKVFGHEINEKNFVARLAKTIEDTNTLTWNGFTDQWTTAIDAWDIAKALYLLLVSGKTGLYHLSYGELFTAYDITMKVANHYPNATINVKPITQADFQQVAQRPEKGGLSNSKFLSEFPNFQFKTIEDYLSERS